MSHTHFVRRYNGAAAVFCFPKTWGVTGVHTKWWGRWKDWWERWREERNEEEEEAASEGPWRYQPQAWLMDTWACSVACWVEGGECGVTVRGEGERLFICRHQTVMKRSALQRAEVPSLKEHASRAWPLKTRSKIQDPAHLDGTTRLLKRAASDLQGPPGRSGMWVALPTRVRAVKLNRDWLGITLQVLVFFLFGIDSALNPKGSQRLPIKLVANHFQNKPEFKTDWFQHISARCEDLFAETENFPWDILSGTINSTSVKVVFGSRDWFKK